MPPARLRYYASALALASALAAAEPKAAPAQSFALKPLAATVAHANSTGIALERIELAPSDDVGRVGDTLTTLVSSHNGAKLRQWLVRFTLAAATAEERAAAKPMTASVTVGEQKYDFTAGEQVALDIQTSGPFAQDGKAPPPDRRARSLISPSLLSLGLDRAGEAMLRTQPTANGKTSAAPPKLSPEEGRAFAGLFPSMITFFNAVQSTPGLREILWDVIEKPSLWSIAKRGGKIDAGFNFSQTATARAEDWGVPNLSCYRMELALTLNGQPALNCAFYVTTPRPPLLATAGIVGIVADSPKDKDKRVIIRVLSGRRTSGAAPLLAETK